MKSPVQIPPLKRTMQTPVVNAASGYTAPMASGLQSPKRVKCGEREFNVGKIPAIPGVELFTECSTIIEAKGWNEIDVHALLKLAPYAEVVLDGNPVSLADANAVNAFLTTEELWKVCLEVYAYNFGFFIAGGTQSVMEPLLRAQEEAQAVTSNTGT